MTDEQKEYQKLLTEREKDLADRNEELEAQHEELTAAVEALVQKNQYLEQAMGELNTRNKEVDQIVYRASHDLKSPITTLEGILNLIESDPAGDITHYINLAKSSTHDMKNLLDMMVRYSNNIVYEDRNELVDFEDLWRRLKVDLKPIENFDKIKIHLRNYTNVNFYGDVFRIESTLFNLLKNCVHFRKGDADRVEVKFSTSDKHLRVSVSDNGRGIPVHIQEDVFGMFYRGSSRSKGSGLGLYLCKKNIQAMGGAINLFSAEGMGTTVTFTVPNKKKEKV